jgi:hypothetical protein
MISMTTGLMPSKAVRKEFGDVSDMTLWRWLADKSLGFPRPIYIRNRRYFSAQEIEEFKRRTAISSLSRK